jgi:hypothetical protein
LSLIDKCRTPKGATERVRFTEYAGCADSRVGHYHVVALASSSKRHKCFRFPNRGRACALNGRPALRSRMFARHDATPARLRHAKRRAQRGVGQFVLRDDDGGAQRIELGATCSVAIGRDRDHTRPPRHLRQLTRQGKSTIAGGQRHPESLYRVPVDDGQGPTTQTRGLNRQRARGAAQAMSSPFFQVWRTLCAPATPCARFRHPLLGAAIHFYGGTGAASGEFGFCFGVNQDFVARVLRGCLGLPSPFFVLIREALTRVAGEAFVFLVASAACKSERCEPGVSNGQQAGERVAGFCRDSFREGRSR